MHGLAALRHDRIPELLAAAGKRGVKVVVYTSTDDKDGGEIKPRALEGRQALIDSGVDLRIARRIHNKSLIMDRKFLIDGSFNWLSAVRDSRNGVQSFEVSHSYLGHKASEKINEIVDELEYRCRLLEQPELAFDTEPADGQPER